MDFDWDVQRADPDGAVCVIKHFAKLEGVVRSKSTAKQAAARDAEMINTLVAQHPELTVAIDLQGVRMRRSIYTYIKESVRLQPARPRHTYIYNAPTWGSKVYSVIKHWLSSEDRASLTICHTSLQPTIVRL